MSHQIRSVLELSYGTQTSKYAYIGQHDFERWFGDHEEGLMVLKLTGTISSKGRDASSGINPSDTTGIIRYVSVSGPHEEDHSAIYLPLSIYQEFELASCIPLKVTPMVAYELEKATKLVLKPLDPVLYSGDMRALLEEALMDYPLLQKHTQFTVYLDALGGYPADVWVEDIEPAEVVQLGGEVEVEFVPEDEGTAADAIVATAAVASAAVASAVVGSATVAEQDSPDNQLNPAGGMSFPLPMQESAKATGHQLGGSTQPLTAAQIRAARLAFYQKA